MSVGLTAQEAEGQAADLERAFRALEEALEAQERSVPGRHERLNLLDAFLLRHGARSPSSLAVLLARTRRGTLRLHNAEPERALEDFDLVLAGAPAEQIDLRGRALYGLAQAHEALRDEAAAKAALERLCAEHEGQRYAKMARVALRRFDAGRRAPPKARDPAPPFDARRDLRDRVRSLGQLAGAPALLVFWSPEAPESVDHLDRLQQVWSRERQPGEQLVSFALGVTDEARRAVQALAEKRGLDHPIVPLPAEFLDEVALDFGVERVPTAVLLDADGTIVARDPPPGRLRELLQAMGR
jgi:hypothetical protein